jgi:hypothetical protein
MHGASHYSVWLETNYKFLLSIVFSMKVWFYGSNELHVHDGNLSRNILIVTYQNSDLTIGQPS